MSMQYNRSTTRYNIYRYTQTEKYQIKWSKVSFSLIVEGPGHWRVAYNKPTAIVRRNQQKPTVNTMVNRLQLKRGYKAKKINFLGSFRKPAKFAKS